jgi:hypothetical protein
LPGRCTILPIGAIVGSRSAEQVERNVGAAEQSQQKIAEIRERNAYQPELVTAATRNKYGKIGFIGLGIMGVVGCNLQKNGYHWLCLIGTKQSCWSSCGTFSDSPAKTGEQADVHHAGSTRRCRTSSPGSRWILGHLRANALGSIAVL